MTKQDMICPSDRCTAYGTKETPHCRKHKATFSCFDPRRRKMSLCPTCIPVEPEPTCPDCGHKAHSYNACFHQTAWQEFDCSCPHTPAEPDSRKVEHCSNCKEVDNGNCACMRNICIKCGKPVGNITFTVCDDCWDKEHPDCTTPTEQMPLIDLGSVPHLLRDYCNQLIKQQQASDMAWLPAHDQQVRKEFAEEVIKTMAVPVEGKRFQAQYNAWKQMVAHIRAMAEEGR